MDIFWYYPYPHASESDLALACLRPGDRLTVQAMRTFRGEVLSPDFSRYSIRRDLPEPPGGDGPSVVRIARRVFDPMTRVRARSRAVAELRPDVCHLHSVNYLVDFLAARPLARRVPLVTTVNDVRPHRSQLPVAVETALLHRLYRTCGHLIVFHAQLRDELVSDFGVDAGRISVVPLPFVSGAPDGRSDTAESLDVLYFGTFRPNKGLEVLVDAAQELGRAGVRVHVAGRGDAPLESMVTAAASRISGLTAEIGYVEADRRTALYRSARVVVLPYTSLHSQSGVLADAYAFRTPVVVTDVGAIGPTVRTDETGWVVPPGDSVALAAAILEALASPPELMAARMDRAAAAHAPAVVGAQLRTIYVAAVEAS